MPLWVMYHEIAINSTIYQKTSLSNLLDCFFELKIYLVVDKNNKVNIVWFQLSSYKTSINLNSNFRFYSLFHIIHVANEYIKKPVSLSRKRKLLNELLAEHV